MKKQKKIKREIKDDEAIVSSIDVRDIPATFPDLSENMQSDLADIFTDAVVGCNICHIWYGADTQRKTTYLGKTEKLKKRTGDMN